MSKVNLSEDKVKTVMRGSASRGGWLRLMNRLLLAGLAGGCWLASPVLASGPFLNGAFIKGANMPWIDGAYYNDLAVNPHYPGWGCAPCPVLPVR